MSREDYKGSEIAVVGLSCRYPGARDAGELWENLKDGRDCISRFSDEEVRAAGIPEALLSRPGYVKAGGVLEQADLFDAAFFGFSPRESQATDPQHRVFLECAWESLEDAGYDPASCDGAVGVYAGMGTGTYLWNVYRSGIVDVVGHHRVMLGTGKDHLPMWVSFKLGLTGPSVNVNSACSTSLVAVHLASQGLLNGECDMALAGGVTVNTQQKAGYLYEEGGILSRDGTCRPFDAAASGTVSGNGVGIVVLKRLDDALADGDSIRAVIRGSAVNNDGAGRNAYTAPSIEGQSRVIAEALAVGEVDPETVTYVETHGTGTLVGDVVEIAALTRAFREAGSAGRGYCAIGSLKASIGHTDTAAGVGSLIKTVLALEHGLLPPSLHFERPNPEIDFESSPFFVNVEARPWHCNGHARRAGVSSFGMGGTNAHVVLEEPPLSVSSPAARPVQLLVLSARTPAALEARRESLAEHLESADPEPPLADVAYTLQVGRHPFAHRLSLVCRDHTEAARVLREADSPRLARGAAAAPDRPVVFLFPGQGAQHPGMARGLYEGEPVFREQVDRGLRLLREETDLALDEALFPQAGREEEAARALTRTALAQPALFVLEHALARLWMDWGISPRAMVGHSVGEYVAACLAEVMSFEDALRLVAARGRLMDRLPGGAMLSVALPEEKLDRWLSPELSLAAVNGPALCVLSGTLDAVARAAAALEAEGVEARRLHTSHAFHSPMMDPVLGELEDRVAKIDLAPPRRPWVSNVTGTWITAEEATDPGYWALHARRPVLFARSAETVLEEDPVLLEVGPGRTLGTLVKQVARAAGRHPAVLTSLRHPRDEVADQELLLSTLGCLWLAGAAVDWPALTRGETRLRVHLPTYPFERKRYWLDAAPLPAAGASAERGAEREAAPETAPLAVELRSELAGAYVAPRSPIERGIAELWARLLGIDRVGLHDGFFELGGHSLLLVQVVAGLRELFGAGVPVAEVAAAQTVAELAAVVERYSGDTATPMAELPEWVAHPEARLEPFPLTEVQEAYWLGRSSAFELGNVATHEYFEYQTEGVEVERLETAWNRLIRRHEMLRAVFLREGLQHILPEVPGYEVVVEDLRGLPAEKTEERLASIRARMSHQVFPADRWPLFELRVSRLDERAIRLHVSIDLLILDAWSVQILIDELLLLYLVPHAELPPLEASFRDYVMAEAAFRESASYERSLAYWRERLPTLPSAPELPLVRDPASLSEPRFRRRSGTLDPERWQRLKARGAAAGVTASAVPLAAFAEVLAYWSKSPRFLVNLTLFNRLPIHPDVDRIVGDFTSLSLLEVDASTPGSFEERARRLQNRFWQDLEHRVVSGVRVLRELTRARAGTGRSALAPVVFTSTLNMRAGDDAEPPKPDDENLLGENVFGISQTPQVWIDHAVGEADGRLVFGWDVVEDLFPPGLMDEIFAAYRDLLERLADDEEAWRATDLELLPRAHRALQAAANETAAPIPEGLLHEGFFARAASELERPAVVAAGMSLSYGELARRARALARRLRDAGARPNRLVAVVMDKGWEQVVAVLAVLEAGAAYLPVDAGLPAERIARLLELGEVSIALLQPGIAERLEWPEGILALSVDRDEPETDPAPLEPLQGPGDLAYVIFTSGSTGTPKGVMIDHRGALNTVADVNGRFGVGPDDVVFGISGLGFDLSVYDVFGTLAAGGTLVLPEPEAAREPARWAEWLAGTGATVWSSVPALMEMLVEHLRGRAEVPGDLRLVLLSGDWIPVDLPDRIRALWPEVEVIGMGGATEASIWSILHPIGDVPEGARSIPYGRAMRNQSFHVLDARLEPRPLWVPGQLYIGGVGLAQGYWHDPEKTAASFITHPRTGERLYRTGDLGRWLPDGEIEFLGREDLQVKVQGHRIELGEIEATLAEHAAVRAAVVRAVGDPRGGKRLVAYVVPAEEVATAAAGPAPAAGDGGAARGIDLIVDPLQRLEFKSREPGLRRDLDGSFVAVASGERGEEELVPYRLRRSFRRFVREPVDLSRLGALLDTLSPVEWGGRPKYRYPSAGSLYPVQVHLYVKPKRVAGLAAGTYYLHPRLRRLVTISDQPLLDGRLFGSDNRPVFEEGAFVLFLVTQYAAVAPIYGLRARDFSLLEAGYMSQLLMSSAPEHELGLCPIGGLELGPLRTRLALEDSHELLHALVGGGVDLEQALSESGAADDYELFQSLLRENTPAAAAETGAQTSPAAASPADVVESVRGFLRQRLPEYMVPAAFMVLPSLPLSANGKVDRKALPDPELAEAETEVGRVAPRNELEAELLGIWEQVLGTEVPGVLDNFFELGGQSLLAARLVARVREELRVELSLASLFDAPNVAGMAAAVERRRSEPASAPTPTSLPQAAPDPDRRHEPFPLTDLQHAYWVGGTGAFELGDLAPLYYAEIEMDALDPARLAEALRRLVERHGMLAATVRGDGTQQIPERAREIAPRVVDLAGLGPEAQQEAVKAIRDAMARPFGDGPLFRVRVTRLGERRHRIHLAVSLLICDAWSSGLLNRELRSLYADPRAALPPLELSFRDYVLAVAALEETPAFRRALDYWRQRLPTLPGAPELPLAKRPAAVRRPEFVRRTFRLEPEAWRRLKARSAGAGLTPDAVLCAAYAEVVATWSKQRHFLLTILYFNRLPVHPEVESILGNFSSTLLLEVDARTPAPFAERARSLQQQLWQDIEHSLPGGVRVLRELNRAQGKAPRAAVPVVFASTVGLGGTEAGEAPREAEDDLVVSHLQTPQVWLDHQAHEVRGTLQANWDAVEELFPPGLVEDMFGAYRNLLERLGAEDDAAWGETVPRLVPAGQLARRERVNRTEAPVPERWLHDGLAERAAERPEAPAIDAGGRNLSFAELDRAARGLGRRLRELGAAPERVVAIVMEKGWEQVAAAFGVLRSGAAYLPIDPALPNERLRYLLERCAVETVLTQPWVEPLLDWPPEVRRLVVAPGGDDGSDETGEDEPPERRPEDLAYVIFTSGSTGLPKGVMIEHCSAVNTVLDVNHRFDVGPRDRVLALSSLSFDLSVWDLFGTVEAGGTIVIPDPGVTREPALLAECADRSRVTIWSSVPALMEMLVDHLEARSELLPASLRLVMLSGDWIPVHLPERIAALGPEVRVVSLGGATEASIWSICHPVERADSQRPSIPYGRPMLNQRFRVLDERLEPRPDWTPGQLFIAGAGLARGYWKDRERTDGGFLRHPRTGERLYRTGDTGRWLPEGEIEFLGREDFQVKVQGYRIELGEIETALGRHPGVRSAVALALGEQKGHKRLVAFVVPVRPEEPPQASELRSFLQDKLPAYMLPASYVVLEALPLSANGKVDRPALARLGSADAGERVIRPPRDETEIRLVGIWEEVLEASPVGIDEDFFDLGGDSVLAVRLMGLIRRELGRELPLAALFEANTVERLADLLRGGSPAPSQAALVRIHPTGRRRPFFCVHPVGGSVLCYVDLARRLGAEQPFYGLQVPGDSPSGGEPDGVETMAARYLEAIREVQPAGPYLLGGWSMGGIIAYEMARQLEAVGEEVPVLAMIDVGPPSSGGAADEPDEADLAALFVRDLAALADREVVVEPNELRSLPRGQWLAGLLERCRGAGALGEDLSADELQEHFERFKRNALALRRYIPKESSRRLALFQAIDGLDGDPRQVAEGWGTLASRGAHLETLPGNHYSLVREPHVAVLGEKLRAALDEADASDP